MALIQCNFFSNSLLRTVPVQVILPTDKWIDDGRRLTDEKPLKTLYLLHGLFGNYTDWVSGTRIQAWAQDKDLAVVMPSGDNKFYVDQDGAIGEQYGTFIHEELVEFTRRSFPLSRKREDTFIGGLSMGGYGSIVNGLKAPQTFGAICALSSALILERVTTLTERTDSAVTDRGFHELVFGDFDKLMGSDKDYYALAKRTAQSNEPLPKIYMACGEEDGLFEVNEKLKDAFLDLGYDVTWEEGPGGHDWIFWDTYIKRVLDWLPLDATQQGRSSGHVSD